MSRPKIFVGIPTRSVLEQQLSGKLADLLLRLSHDASYQVTLSRMAGYPVDRMRNVLVDQFLKTDCDFLLMIDDDIVPPDDILAMAHHDKDVVGALCYAWSERLGVFSVAYERMDHALREYRRPGIGPAIEKRGLLPMDLVGTGCLMVHRRVFTGWNSPYFKTVMDESLTRLLDSEDFYFCKEAQKRGFKVFLDTDRVCSHFKAVDLRSIARWAENRREEQQRQGLVQALRGKNRPRPEGGSRDGDHIVLGKIF